jgi:DNA-binding SARP family transcriptional activator
MKSDTVPLTLTLFGPCDIRLHGRPLPRLRSRKGLWLLTLLALRHDREVERSWLAGTLWPDSDTPQAAVSLRTTLVDLRRALGPEAYRLRSPTSRTLRLDLTGATVDVITFDAALARGDAASLAEAAQLYRGLLLEGCEEEWVTQEREAREEAYLQTREQLAAVCIAVSDAAGAAGHLRLAVAADPLRETAQRGLMEALAAGGNYAAAMEVYRELRDVLHRELNTEAAPETVALYQRIRAAARARAGEGEKSPHPAPLGTRPAQRVAGKGERARGREGERTGGVAVCFAFLVAADGSGAALVMPPSLGALPPSAVAWTTELWRQVRTALHASTVLPALASECARSIPPPAIAGRPAELSSGTASAPERNRRPVRRTRGPVLLPGRGVRHAPLLPGPRSMTRQRCEKAGPAKRTAL